MTARNRDQVNRTTGDTKSASLFAYSSPSHTSAVPELGPPARSTLTTSTRTGFSSAHASAVVGRTKHEYARIVVVVAVTALYLLVLGLMLQLSTGTASTGILTERDASGRWAVIWVVPASPAYDLGVSPGAIVVPSDGIERASQQLNPDQSQSIDVLQGGVHINVDVSGRQVDSTFRRWGYTLLGLIFVFIGGPVFLKARQRSAAAAFYIFCISTATALAVAMCSALSYGWALALQFVTMAVVAASFACFFFLFPVPMRGSPWKYRLFIITLIGATLALLASYLLVLTTTPSNYAWLQPLYYLYMAACGIAGLLRLIISLFTEREQEVRRQRALLIVGTVLGVGPSILLGLVPPLVSGHRVVDVQTTAFTLGFLPIFFAYAITQHQLLGIRSFVRRSVVYVISGFAILSIFFMVAALASSVLPGDWTRDEGGLFGFGIFVFLIALSFGYVQKRVEWMVDRFIYHDAYDYKQALLEFSTQLAAEQDLDALSQALVERTCRMMNLDCGTLLLAVHPGEVSAMVARNAPPVAQTVILEGDSNGLTDTSEIRDTRGVRLNMTMTIGPLYTTGRQNLRGKETLPNVHDRDSDSSYLLAYAHYGECADWLPQALQSELVRQKMDLRHTSAPTEFFNFYAGPANRTIGSTANGPIHTGPLGRRQGDSEDTLLHRLTSSRHPYPDAMRPFLGVPLWTRQRFVGILCLGSKRSGERYSKDDLSLLSTLGGQAALAIYNAQLYEMREQALLDTITALAHAIEAKDTYTLNHCEKITGRAVALGQALGLPHHEVVNIRLGSILHDVGKIGIPDAILNKPAKLTEAEYEQVKEHAVIGARIVQSVGALQGVVPIVRHHQERFDGSGYPDGLKGDAIPIGARIIAVVDAYGAMTEDRVYRKAPGHETAVAELKRWAGKQFDPYIAEAFIRLLEVEPELAEG